MSDLPATGNEGREVCPECGMKDGEHQTLCSRNVCPECHFGAGQHLSTCSFSSRATVDGKEAVIDGTRKPPPEQPRLIRVPSDEVLRELADRQEAIDAAKVEKKRASDKHKALVEARDEYIREIEKRVDEDEQIGFFDEVAAAAAAPSEPQNVTPSDPNTIDHDPDENVPPAEPPHKALPRGRNGAPKLEKGQTAAQWVIDWGNRMRTQWGPDVRDTETGTRITWFQALCKANSPAGEDYTKLDQGVAGARIASVPARAMAADWEDSSTKWPAWIGQG
jgi:hypothetical protein